MQKLLTEKEDIFCEPSSSTSLAGAMRDIKNGKILESFTIVCTLTDYGLKDFNTTISQCNDGDMIHIDPVVEEVKNEILDNM